MVSLNPLRWLKRLRHDAWAVVSVRRGLVARVVLAGQRNGPPRLLAAEVAPYKGSEVDALAKLRKSAQLERYRCATDRSFVTFVNPVPAKGSEIAFALAESRPDLRFLFVAGWPVGAAEDRARQARARRAGNIAWQASVQMGTRHCSGMYVSSSPPPPMAPPPAPPSSAGSGGGGASVAHSARHCPQSSSV